MDISFINISSNYKSSLEHASLVEQFLREERRDKLITLLTQIMEDPEIPPQADLSATAAAGSGSTPDHKSNTNGQSATVLVSSAMQATAFTANGVGVLLGVSASLAAAPLASNTGSSAASAFASAATSTALNSRAASKQQDQGASDVKGMQTATKMVLNLGAMAAAKFANTSSQLVSK